MSKADEIIVVVDRKKLFDNEELAFQGYESDPDRCSKIYDNIERNYGLMRRGSTSEEFSGHENAEMNFDFKQPIPYAIIRRGNEVFVYERLSGGGEDRLHGSLSLGVGGHMTTYPVTESVKFDYWLNWNLERELEEELSVSLGEKEVRTLGFINDDENEVGRVHIGMLVVIDLEESATVEVREKDQLRGTWSTVEEIRKPENYERLESWSQIALDSL